MAETDQSEEEVPEDLIDQAEELDRSLQTGIPLHDHAEIPAEVAEGIKALNSLFASEKTAIIGSTDSQSPIRSQLPSSIGRFEIREQAGFGSHGIVYRAFDPVLNREVAVKLARVETTLSEDLTKRFLRESEAASRLHHPHLVQVFEAGAENATAFIVSEFCHGESLAEWLAHQDCPVQPRLAASLIAALADALHYTHTAEILHRDVKPSNILLSDLEAPHRGVKLTDFGLAYFLDRTGTTIDGQIIGTANYMPPEQIRGIREEFGPGIDLYALGVILYQMLTLKLPFDSHNSLVTLKKICEETPPSMREANPLIPRDLEAICLRCLEKSPADRYATAGKLRDDLKRYLDGRPTVARPLTQFELFARWCRQNKKVASLATLSTILLTAVAVVSFFAARQLEQRAHELSDALNLAKTQTQIARKTSYISEMKLAYQRFEEDRIFEASEILADQIPSTEEIDLRGVEWHYLDTKIKSLFRVIGVHPGGVEDLALFPDGNRIASVGMDGSLRFWDLTSGKQLRNYQLHHRPIHAVAVSPDGRWIAYGEEDYPYDSHVVIIDPDTGRELSRLNHFEYTIRALEFSVDGNFLISSAAGDGEVDVWEFREGLTRGELHNLTRHDGSARYVCLTDDGNTLLTPDVKSKQLALWDLASLKKIKTLNNPNKSRSHSAVAYNPSQRLTAFASPGTSKGEGDLAVLEIVDADTGFSLAHLESHSREEIAFTPNGSAVLAGSYSGWIELWKFRLSQSPPTRKLTVESQTRFRATNGIVTNITICPSGSDALVTGSDGVIALCHLGHEESESSFAPEQIRVTNIAASSDSALFAWVGDDDRVRLTDYRTGQLLDTSEELGSFPRSLLFSPCGTLLAAQCDAEFVHCWDIKTRTLEKLGSTKFGKGNWPDHVAVDRQNVIGFGEDQDQCNFLVTENLQRDSRILSEVINGDAVLLSPDGQSIILSGQKLWVYERDTLKLLYQSTHNQSVYGMTISRNSKMLASGHRDSSILLRDLKTGQLHHHLTGHNFAVRALAFANNDTRLITGDGRGYLGFWDVETGNCYGFCREFTDLNHWIRKIEVGSDERWLDITAGYKLPHRWTKRVPLRSHNGIPSQITSSRSSSDSINVSDIENEK